MKEASPGYLSKTLFMNGVQCPKFLYLQKYHPEWRDEISEEQEKLFQTGNEVGMLARQLFPGGVEIPYEGLSHQDQIQETQKAIQVGIEILYEATFSFYQIFVKNDLLLQEEKGWDLYEVKASTEIKDHYIDDIALQFYVVKNSGLPMRKAYLVHINNQYVREGDIEPEKLFLVEEVTEKVLEKQEWVKEEISRLRRMLSGEEPKKDIGAQCEDPYPCDFIGHCWQHIPENSVFDLRGPGTNLYELYQQGYIKLKDVPMELLATGQRFQLEAYLNQAELWNTQAIREFLQTLWYPLYFLDFETISSAIPLFDGTHPYQQIPYQYSLHYLEKENGDLGHLEFLADPHSDFREELIKRLCQQIPSNACVMAYYASFERGRLEELADSFPQYKEKIKEIIKNIRDLIVPFRKKDVYHWKMKGSYSIKNVLPCLCPDMDYANLEIQNGGMATNAFRALSESNDPVQTTNLRQALLGYCRLDTLAMVKILEALREKCKG